MLILRVLLSVSILALFSGPSLAGEAETRFDGVWVGNGPPDLCSGESKIEFTVKNGVIEGEWYRGARYRNARTLDISAKLGSGDGGKPVTEDRVLFNLIDGAYYFQVDGRFKGSSAQGTIRSGQKGACYSFWTATRIIEFSDKLDAVASEESDAAKVSQIEPAAGVEDGPTIASRLQMLNDLLEQGLVTPGEAKAARSKILEEL